MSNKNIYLYTNGDSVSWGAELEDKRKKFSTLLCKNKNWVDFNVASAGISNDRIFRNTIRDVTKFLNGKPIYNENLGYCTIEKIFVLISFTSPTRVDYFDGDVFKVEHFWHDNDKWGLKDAEYETKNEFIINNSKTQPSFVRLFNQIITLDSFLTLNKIPHLFTNAFFVYEESEFEIIKSNLNVDKVLSQFDDPDDYFGLHDLYHYVPESYKKINLIQMLKNKNIPELLAERGHPSEEGHKEIYNFLKDKINYE